MINLPKDSFTWTYGSSACVLEVIPTSSIIFIEGPLQTTKMGRFAPLHVPNTFEIAVPDEV